MKKLFFIAFLLFTLFCSGQKNIIETARNYIEIKCNKSFNEVLFVNITEQKMYYIKEGGIVKTYVISSSSY